MEENTTVEEYYVVAESLIKIAFTIQNIYRELYKLEMKGFKDSTEYKKFLEYLDMAIEREEEIYQERNLNAFKCNEIISLLINRYMNGKILSDEEVMITEKYNDTFLRRVIKNLTGIMKNDYAGMLKLKMNEFLQVDDNCNIEDLSYLDCIFDNYFLIDYVNRLYYLLCEKIDSTSNLKIKNKLIKNKYFISYLYRINEKEFFKNGFSKEENVIDNGLLINFATGFSNYEFLLKRNNKIIKKIKKQLAMLTKKNNINEEEIIMIELIIRALQMMLNDQLINNNDNNSLIQENSPLIAKNVMNECLKNLKNDRNKQITLKL